MLPKIRACPYFKYKAGIQVNTAFNYYVFPICSALYQVPSLKSNGSRSKKAGTIISTIMMTPAFNDRAIDSGYSDILGIIH